MTDCIFCKIIAGEIPAQKVYEDEHTFAFLDITPVNPGHTLVLPKHHARNILDIAPEDWAAVCETARKLAIVIKESVRADGINVHVNNEPAAGQVVFHSHIHVIPRSENDGYKMWHGKQVPEAELQSIREKIIAKL